MSRFSPGSSPRPDQRKIGDSPAIGKVSKMREGFDPRSDVPGISTRRRRPDSQLKPLPVWRTLGLIAVSLAVLVGVGALIFASLNGKKAPQAAPSEPVAAVETPPPEPARLEKMTHTFLAATQPPEISSVVHLGGQDPATLLNRLDALNALDGPLKSVEYLGPIQNLTQPLEAVVVFFQNGHNRIALFCPDRQGEWQMDFDAYSRECSTPWKEMLGGGDAEGLARVYVSTDVYYNGHFADEKSWACSGIYSPDEERLMFAYAARNSPADKAIRDALSFKLKTGAIRNGRPTTSSRMLRMMLQLRHHAGDEPRQFEVVNVIADDWATPVRPLEDHYR